MGLSRHRRGRRRSRAPRTAAGVYAGRTLYILAEEPTAAVSRKPAGEDGPRIIAWWRVLPFVRRLVGVTAVHESW
jgi:hypothetical protein